MRGKGGPGMDLFSRDELMDQMGGDQMASSPPPITQSKLEPSQSAGIFDQLQSFTRSVWDWATGLFSANQKKGDL